MDNGRFRTGREIGRGAFSQIRLGLDTRTGEKVALKSEDAVTKHPQLVHESEIYTHLQGGRGIPRLHWVGKRYMYRVMVTDLLGPSLEDLFDSCGRKFSLKTILMLADQLIDILEYIHSRGVLHRDIKPENFLMGLGSNANQVHVIDFGLAGFYKDQETGEHIPWGGDRCFVGTPCYASCLAHIGYEQGRRNDIESLGYVLMYFLRGSLPWQEGPSAEIGKRKLRFPLKDLCTSYPHEFTEYFFYCKLELNFKQDPDYSYLKRLFRQLLTNEGYEFDHVYDWSGKTITLPGERVWATEDRKISNSSSGLHHDHSSEPAILVGCHFCPIHVSRN